MEKGGNKNRERITFPEHVFRFSIFLCIIIPHSVRYLSINILPNSAWRRMKFFVNKHMISMATRYFINVDGTHLSRKL